MHLKSLTLKGFKSFPDRTRLDFGPGVSVVVGPNGSGKSNVTDAVLWAMGEQSPLAVRGQSMQDVIFGGGQGVKAHNAAEVEIVLDNSDATVEVPLSEISIVRRLDRAGEGGYWLNGARCRLGDVIELLSDTGLGKETHSIISQGRVEQIVTSRPRERRMLIEEAAGLGKHRKRRRRAQLKLERTQDNLDRALDIEREARTRLRPLKRQAEAAQLHERLERQTLEAQLELAVDAAARSAQELQGAEAAAEQVRAARDQIEARLARVVERRAGAERALAERGERYEALTRGVFDARSAGERVALRGEQVQACTRALTRRIEGYERELGTARESEGGQQGTGGAQASADGGHERAIAEASHPPLDESERRIAALVAQLAELRAAREPESDPELDRLLQQAEQDQGRLAELEAERERALQAREGAAELLEQARSGSVWSSAWQEVRRVIEEGVRRALARPSPQERRRAAEEVATEAERVARGAVEIALDGVRSAERRREQADGVLREAERRFTEAGEQLRDRRWQIEQRRTAASQGPLAVRQAQLEGELAAERRAADQHAREQSERRRQLQWRSERDVADRALMPTCERLGAVLRAVGEAVRERVAGLEAALAGDREAGEQMARDLRSCAQEEADIQARLREISDSVTSAEVAAQRARDQAGEAALERDEIAARLGLDPAAATGEGRGQAGAGAEPGAGDSAEHAPGAVAETFSDATGAAAAGVTEHAGLDQEQCSALRSRVERLTRRREQLGPVNPLAQDEYAGAVTRVEEMEARRADTETAMRELRAVIRDADRRIAETFEETFQAAARNFEALAAEIFPGGAGRLKLLADEHLPRQVLGGQSLGEDQNESGDSRLGAPAVIGGREAAGERAGGPEAGHAQGAGESDAAGPSPDAPETRPAGDAASAGGAEHPATEAERRAQEHEEKGLLGVEIEITPAGKTTKRLSLLSGGEKSMTALAFLFAVFLARPCPFYILDEVEAALDDLNLDRFLALLRRHSQRAQFIVITHQKRTMEAADWLYGVSMGGDGVSKVLSRRLPPDTELAGEVAQVA